MGGFSLRLALSALLFVTSFSAAAVEVRTEIVPAGSALDDLMTPDELEDTLLEEGLIADPDLPIIHKISNPKVFAYVNRTTQEMLFTAPELASGQVTVSSRVAGADGRGTFKDRTYDVRGDTYKDRDGTVWYRAKVSTGGTLKEPGNLLKGAYCASTPLFNNFIPAQGRLFRDYKSGTFVSDTGEGAAMNWAIHVVGGIFLHEVPPTALTNMGKPVSGGCIRVYKKSIEILYGLVAKHGGLQLEIFGDNPPSVSSCRVPPEVAARRAQLRARCQAAGKTGRCYMSDIR
jgi:hypothetical protein